MALSRPRTTRRVLRGSALGLGLLVAGGITAPAAFAIEEPEDAAGQPAELDGTPVPLQETPAETGAEADVVLAAPLTGDFGTGKDFTVQVAPTGPVPADLDLSGAVFRATPTDGSTTVYECTTDEGGSCAFHGPYSDVHLPLAFTAERSDASLPTGSFVLTQVAASPGLAVNSGSATFGLCSSMFCGFGRPNGTAVVSDDSLFRQELVTTVIDSATGAPVACAAYELTGPDYPHDGGPVPPVPAADPAPAECLPASTETTTTAPTTTTAAPLTTAPAATAPTATGTPERTDTTSPSSSDAGTPDATADPTTTTNPGPGVVELLGFAREDATRHDFGTQTSDADGTLTFRGWFLPAEGYLLTPATLPAGFTPDAADAFGIVTTPRQAAAGTPAQVLRTVTGTLASGAPAPGTTDVGVAPAASTTTTAAAVPTGAPAAAAPAPAPALATTGGPVETMALLGGGLVALGAGALATGGVLRRRARQRV